MPPSDFDRDLTSLELELKRLENDYNKYFAGLLARPPLEARARVTGLIKQYDRAIIQIQNTGQRFRFSTIQSRYAALNDLWDRGQRAREEGRGGPFAHKRPPPAPAVTPAEDRIVHVASIRDPTAETDKMQELYASLTEARRALGQDAVPFEKFQNLVTQQVQKMTGIGAPEVAFRVAVKDGKVSLTAKGLRGASGSSDGDSSG